MGRKMEPVAAGRNFPAHHEVLIDALQQQPFSGLASASHCLSILGRHAVSGLKRLRSAALSHEQAAPACSISLLRGIQDASGDLRLRTSRSPQQNGPFFAAITASALADPPGGEGEGGSDERVLISQVEIKGADNELKQVALDVLATKPNFAYTLEEVKNDVERVFATGYFSEVDPAAEDTRDGIKLVITVKPNAPLTGVVVSGANMLPASVITRAFATQHGKTLNFGRFSRAVQKVNGWYEERGMFGQVVDVDVQDGVATMKVAEALVEQVNLKFVPIGGGEETPHGNTRPEVILRHLATRPGRVYSQSEAKHDLDAVYAMGIADDVNIIPTQSEGSTPEAPKVDLTLNIVQRKTGGLSAGGGLSAHGTDGGLPKVIGSFTYSQKNLLNRNQKLNASIDIGQAESMFRLSHHDPWVRSDPFRTSRTCSLMNTRSTGSAIHGKVVEDEEEGASNESLSIERLCGGVEYQRPLSVGWSGTAGLNWQRAKCLDERRQVQTQDCYGCPLTFSGREHDSMMLGLLRIGYSGHQGDLQVMASTEQALPLRPDWLNFNRLRVTADRTFRMGPCRLHLMGKGGAILGDLPPYEAFPLGGAGSVRGYPEGGVGTGRHFIGVSTEFVVPLISPVDGAAFVDYGSDLDSGATVLGDPAGVRGKPGSGFGFGAGIRVESPFGPLRLDCAFNAVGKRRFHLGIGSGG